MRKYGHCNSLDFYKKSILNLFTWQSTDGNIWRHLDDYSVIKKKGKDLVDFVSISPSDKDEYEAVGYLNPSPRSRSDLDISPIGIRFRVYLYSVDFGIDKSDPNRGLWIQGKEDGAWYRLCNPSEEYRTIHELNSLKTRSFLELYDLIKNNEEDFDDMSDPDYLYCNLTVGQFIAKIKSKNYDTSVFPEFRAFYYRNFDTTFSPNCPFMKSFKNFVNNSSQNLLNSETDVYNSSPGNIVPNRKRKYILDDDDDEDVSNVNQYTSSDSIVTDLNEENTNLVDSELTNSQDNIVDTEADTEANTDANPVNNEIIETPISSLSSSSKQPVTNTTINTNSTSSKNINKSINSHKIKVKSRASTSPNKNSNSEITPKKLVKPTKIRESSNDNKNKDPIKNTPPNNEDNSILLKYHIGSRVYAKEENARHFNFGIITEESEDKNYFTIKWDVNDSLSIVPKIPSCFEDFENKRRSIQTEKYVPTFKSDSNSKKDNPIIIIDDDDDDDDSDEDDEGDDIKEVAAKGDRKTKSNRTEKKKNARSKTKTTATTTTTTTGKRSYSKRKVTTPTTKKKKIKRDKTNTKDMEVEYSESDNLSSSDESMSNDDDDDDDDNYEGDDNNEIVPDEQPVDVEANRFNLSVPVNSRRVSDSVLPSTTTKLTSLTLLKPAKQRHHSDTIEPLSAKERSVHSSSSSNRKNQDELIAILNKQRESGGEFHSGTSTTSLPAFRAVLTPTNMGSSHSFSAFSSTTTSTSTSKDNSSIEIISNKALPKKPLNTATTSTVGTPLIDSVSKTLNVITAEGKSGAQSDNRKGSKSSSSIRPDWEIAMDQRRKDRLAVTSDRISRQDIPPNMIPVGIRDDYSAITRNLPVGPTTSPSNTISTRVNDMRDLNKATSVLVNPANTGDNKTNLRQASSLHISNNRNVPGSLQSKFMGTEKKDHPSSTLLTSSLSTQNRIKKKSNLIASDSVNANLPKNFSSLNIATSTTSIDNNNNNNHNNSSSSSSSSNALVPLDDSDGGKLLVVDDQDAPKKLRGVRFADDDGGHLSTTSTIYTYTNDILESDSDCTSALSSYANKSNDDDTNMVGTNKSDDNKSPNFSSNPFIQRKLVNTGNSSASSVLSTRELKANDSIVTTNQNITTPEWGSGWGDTSEVDTTTPSIPISSDKSITKKHPTTSGGGARIHSYYQPQPPALQSIPSNNKKQSQDELGKQQINNSTNGGNNKDSWGSGWGEVDNSQVVSTIRITTVSGGNNEQETSRGNIKNNSKQDLSPKSTMINKNSANKQQEPRIISHYQPPSSSNNKQYETNNKEVQKITAAGAEDNTNRYTKDESWGSGWGDEEEGEDISSISQKNAFAGGTSNTRETYQYQSQRRESPLSNKYETSNKKKVIDDEEEEGWGKDTNIVVHGKQNTKKQFFSDKESTINHSNVALQVSGSVNNNNDKNDGGAASTSWGSGWGEDSNEEKGENKAYDKFTSNSTNRNSEDSANDIRSKSRSSYSYQRSDSRDRSRSSSSDRHQRRGGGSSSWNNNNNRDSQVSKAVSKISKNNDTEIISRSNNNSISGSPRSGNIMPSPTSAATVLDKNNVTKSNDSASENSWGGGW